jgi:hypothetical protein
VLRAIPEEPKGAVAKVQEHAHTIALLEAACLVVVFLAVAPEVPMQTNMNQPSVLPLLQ